MRTKLLLANRNTNVSAYHPHAQPHRAFCPQKPALLFRSVWWHSWLGGHYLLQLITGVLPQTPPFIFPWVRHRKGALHHSHNAVAEVLALSTALLVLWYTSCSSHSCQTSVSWISWVMILRCFRQFYFFLFCIGEKKAIRRDRKQQFINIIQTCEILLPLRSCSNVWAT